MPGALSSGDEGLGSMTNGAAAVACITACQQSHQFQDRKIPLGEDYVKIGRSVARLKPQTDNGIFDCKVLSRNHAVIWYEDQSFFLKDTKSSNGTFVNNERLSKGAEESPPKEIYSGDIIQFGVDIIENAKKVTHGCIIAMVRLHHPDGREAINTARSISEESLASLASTGMGAGSGESVNVPPGGICISSAELFQLHQYIKEASHRESMLESKLGALQGLVTATQEASETNWKALVDEDRLLSRIEMLEAQLATFSKAATEDKLREEVIGLQKEKEAYESAAKESLRRALEEKVEAVSKMSDVERCLETTEEEVARLRDTGTRAEDELSAVRSLHAAALARQTALETEIAELQSQVSEFRSASKAQSPTFQGDSQTHVSQLHSVLEGTERGEVDRRLQTILEATTAKFTAQGMDPEAIKTFSSDLSRQVSAMFQSEEIVTPPLMNGNGHEDLKELRAAKEDLANATASLEKITNELNTVQKQRLEVADDALQQRQEKERFMAATELAESQVKQLQSDLAAKTEEVEFERRMRADAEASTSASPKDDSREVFHRQAAKNQAEFATLKDECGRMRERMVAVEGEMRAGRKENARLAAENRQLHEATRRLTAQSESKPRREGQPDWQFEAEALRMDNERIQNELREARSLASNSEERLALVESEASSMRVKLSESGLEMDLPLRDQLIAALHGVPVLVIVLAVVCAFFPFFAAFTATSEPDLPDTSS